MRGWIDRLQTLAGDSLLFIFIFGGLLLATAIAIVYAVAYVVYHVFGYWGIIFGTPFAMLILGALAIRAKRKP